MQQVNYSDRSRARLSCCEPVPRGQPYLADEALGKRLCAALQWPEATLRDVTVVAAYNGMTYVTGEGELSVSTKPACDSYASHRAAMMNRCPKRSMYDIDDLARGTTAHC